MAGYKKTWKNFQSEKSNAAQPGNRTVIQRQDR